jgi:sugar (pentulose or hexulose) kinase
MNDDLLLGIDAGTSIIKAALFNRAGECIAVASRATKVMNLHPGWSETAPSFVWYFTTLSIRDVLAKAGVDGSAVKAIGLTGNMVGAWLVGGWGESVRHAILWNDGRSQSVIARLTARTPDLMERVFSSTGAVMQPGCTLPVIRWLADNEPEVFEDTAYVMCCKDYLRFKLTYRIHTDQTEASVMPGDIRTRGYSEAMFDLLDVREYRGFLPPVVPSETVCGGVIETAAKETGLAVGTPVVAGAGDVPASALGAGAVEPGVACVILGTTCLSCLTTAEPMFTPPNVGLNFVLPPDRWLRVMANIAGTTNLDWFISQFYATEKAAHATADLFALLEHEAELSPVGANGVLYHPYLSPVGVIAPFVEAGARAQFFGLLPTHTRADLLRAVYEGVALAIRDCYAAMDVPLAEVRLSGGGAKSALWCQMIADCLGVRVVVPAGEEFGAKGAALLAGTGIGWYANPREAAHTTDAITRSYTPNPAHTEAYNRVYVRYRAVREALQGVWRVFA